MSSTTTPLETSAYCVNHPQTETLLRCNRCNKPVCLKCVQRTPVGYRCNECLGLQRQGYYTATATDYILTVVIGGLLGAVGGFIMTLIGGFWLLAIFAGPAAGAIISESIRRAIGRRRGRYIALGACLSIALGSLFGVALPALAIAIGAGAPQALYRLVPGLVLNLGFLIFIGLTLSTTFARLRV